MTIGDLVKYEIREGRNQVLGLVVGIERLPPERDLDYLHVQWLDWADGEIAIEHPCALVVISKAE